MDMVEAFSVYPGLMDEILSSLHQTVIVTNPGGQVIFANQVAETTIGFTRDEFSGQELSVIFTPEDLTYLYPNLLFLARKNQPFEGEVMLKRKNDTRFFAYMIFQPMTHPDTKQSVVVICIQNIDKQKQFERVLRETHFDDMVKVANGIAHELRNPLVGIGGFAGRLFNSCQADSSQEKYYNYIISNLRRIENLVKKVDLLVSLPKPYFQQSSSLDLVEEAQASYVEEMMARDIRFQNEVEDAQILVDHELVVRALTVLFENALDAMPDHGLLKVGGQSLPSEYEFEIRDNGHGIEVEDMPHIFNPFFSTKADGTGIDLAVVKRVMEGHGGRVEAESTPGQGAVFRLQFPFERRRTIRTASLAD